MAGNLKRAAKYVGSSREDLLELLEKLLADQETSSDKIVVWAWRGRLIGGCTGRTRCQYIAGRTTTVTGSIRTIVTPCRSSPRIRAVPGDRSIMRGETYGPRSSTMTSACLPFDKFVTINLVPNGYRKLAALFDAE